MRPSTPSTDRSTPFVEGDPVALIELDGGLGTIGYARLIEATRGVVPVGAVMFGAEALTAQQSSQRRIA